MNFSRPLRFIAFIAAAIIISSALNVAVTKQSFSESYHEQEDGEPYQSLASNR